MSRLHVVVLLSLFFFTLVAAKTITDHNCTFVAEKDEIKVRFLTKTEGFQVPDGGKGRVAERRWSDMRNGSSPGYVRSRDFLAVYFGRNENSSMFKGSQKLHLTHLRLWRPLKNGKKAR